MDNDDAEQNDSHGLSPHAYELILVMLSNDIMRYD